MFEQQECVDCFCKFGVPIGFTASRRSDKRRFFCPNGHSMSYTESDADKLRRERDRLAQQLAYKDDLIADERRRREEAERATSAQKGVVTKLRKRASAGVCPCCNRTVSQMARHMASKHPTFKAEAA